MLNLEHINFYPPLPMPLVFGIGGVLALLVIATYARSRMDAGWFRKTLLAVFRLGVVAGLVIVLLRPMELKPETEIVEKPVFAILVDDSASMNTEDLEEGQSRFGAAVAALEKESKGALKELEKEFELKYYRFSKNLSRSSLSELTALGKPEGEGTHLATSLMNAVQSSREGRRGGILLISDGRENETDNLAGVRNVARHLRSMKIPIWTVPLGTTAEVKDVYVRARLSSNFLFLDQPAALYAEISASGFSNYYARVNLYRENEYVTSQEVLLRSGRAKVTFPIREEHKGAFQYRVEVEPLAGETDLVNNQRTVIARVVDERTRVLVLEAQPYWDSKFLLRVLRADPNIDVTSIFSINEKKTFAIADTIPPGALHRESRTENIRMPRTREELYKYDCVFVGKDLDQTFTSEELKMFRDYLTERGGSLVFFRGKPYSGENPELAAIEPIEWGSQKLEQARFELTSQGRSSPIFNFRGSKSPDIILREMPEMISITDIVKEKSLAIVLATTKNDNDPREIAAIAYQRYGKGKVMSIGATGLWRWAFMPENLKEYDDVYRKFWAQMVRWLIAGSDFLPGQDIAFRIDKYSYNPGESVRLTVQTKFMDPTVFSPLIKLTGPDGKTASLTPQATDEQSSIYTAFFTPEKEGQYKAVLNNKLGEMGEFTNRFTVYEDSLERRYVAADRELMEQLSEMTGGRMLSLKDLGALPTQASEFQRLTREKVKPRDVWDRLSVFCVLIAFLGIEWLVRRKSGLV